MSTQPIHNEEALLSAVASGNRQAYTQLYSRYVNLIYRYILPFFNRTEDADDVLQEIFIAVWTNREKLPHIQHFKHYLIRMARNRCLNAVRNQRIQSKVKAALDGIEPAGDQHGASTMEYKQLAKIASDVIDQLTPRQKEIFMLRTQEELSLDEIATELEISRSAVKKQLYVAIAFVREKLEPHITSVIAGLTLLAVLLKKFY